MVYRKNPHETVGLVLIASCDVDPLRQALQVALAQRGIRCIVETATWAAVQPVDMATNPEVLLLLPWDLVADLSWCRGVPADPPDLRQLELRMEEVIQWLATRHNTTFAYLPAPIPPICGRGRDNRILANTLVRAVSRLSPIVLPSEMFSCTSLFDHGCAIADTALSTAAEILIRTAMAESTTTAKVLVTDCDHVLWSGVVAEDGVEGISFGPCGQGYPHFAYQRLLVRLKRDGILLAAVTRNDPEVVGPLLASGRLQLNDGDFVAGIASHDAKSAQIRQLSEQLGLSLDSFVFVDDNPVELAEVASALPKVRCLQFPEDVRNFPSFLEELAGLFPRGIRTAEDRDRTAYYRQRLEGVQPSQLSGADLSQFLRGLEMRLTVENRTHSDSTRALQLINKTNVFNLNGHRFSDREITELLVNGGQLWTATLEDRTGNHGEVLACLTDGDNVVRSFAMSCRVLQRRVEYAFLVWFTRLSNAPQKWQFVPTDRNEPMRRFFADPAFRSLGPDEPMRLDTKAFATTHADDLSLFDLRTVGV